MKSLTPAELDRRIFALFDGTITPGEHAGLERRLLADPAARDRYVELSVLHGLLEVEAEQRRHGVRQGPVPVELVIDRQRRRLIRLAVVSAAAVLLLTAVVLRLLFAPPPSEVRMVRSAGTVLSITHAASAGKPQTEDMLVPGSELHLVQGTVELSFASGVKAVIQGPETLRVINQNCVSLQKGTAWFQVPKGGRGFQVFTPELQVTDLGTEFGVITRPDGADEVHVFKGKVIARASQGRMESATLVAGQARSTFVVGKLEEISSAPEKFLTRLPRGLPYLHWSFEESDPSAIQPKGRHPLAGKIHAYPRNIDHVGALRGVPGPVGRALATDGTGAYLKTDWEAIGGAAPRSMAYWIRLTPGKPYLDPVVGWGVRSDLRAFYSCVAIPTRDNGIREGHAVVTVSFEGAWYEGTTPLDDGHWHHLAAVFTGGYRPDGTPEVILYVDGKSETIHLRTNQGILRASSGRVNTDIRSPSAFPLTLFCHLDGRPDGIDHPVEIDELFIFSGTITPEQVENLWRFNRPERNPE